MSKRLNQILIELISTMNSTLFWGPMGFRRQSQDMTSYYDPRYATGWEDYTTHMSIGAASGPTRTSIGSTIPIEGYGLTNKKVEEQEDEEKEHNELAIEQPVPLQQPPSVGQFDEEEEEKEEEEKVKKSDLADIREQPEEEEEEEVPAEPEEDPAVAGEEEAMPDMPGGEEDMGIPGMPGEEDDKGPETPEEVGRVYELKKIYSRLLSINQHLAESTDGLLLKLRLIIGQSIEVFEVMIANIDLFKDKVDDIIVLYYEFLERVYGILKKYYEVKRKEDEKDKKDAKTTDKPERISPEFGPQSSENPMYNKL